MARTEGQREDRPECSTVEEDLATHEGDRLLSQDGKKSRLGPSTPLPRLQIFVICCSRFAEPIALTNIFPFVYFMIKDFFPGIEEDRVGYYVGTVESCFAFAQFLTVFWWGRLSDKIGRKPVILIGLSGVIISTLLFGLAKAFWFAIVARMVNGMLNGNVSIYKSMIGEITDRTNQALAFSFLSLCFAVGSIIGPMIGGFLAMPAEQFPSIPFFQGQFWKEFPYFLPCAVSSLFLLFSFVTAFLFMEETLPAKVAVHRKAADTSEQHTSQRSVQDYGTMERNMDTGREARQDIHNFKPSPTPWQSFCTRGIVIMLSDYMILALQCIALDALIYLFCATPIDSGGLSFRSGDIGIVLSIHGVLSVFIQVFVFPPTQKRLGTVRLWRILMAMYPIIFAMFPVVNAIARVNLKTSDGLVLMWTGIVIIIALKAIANMAFGCNMILVNSNAPSPHALGTMNGIAQTCASFVRAIGPASATSLFALSISGRKGGMLQGQLVWILLILLAIIGFILSLWVEEGRNMKEDQVATQEDDPSTPR